MIEINVISVGNVKEKYLQELIADYKKRISKYAKIELIELKDESNKINENVVKETEGERILSSIKEGFYVILLDLKGQMLDSISLSKKLDEVATYHSSKIAFIIGGSFGVSEDVKKEIRDKYTDGNPYFMFVGSLHPRKNLARLFTSFDLFKKRNNNDIKLLIVGSKRWWTEPIKNAYEAMTHKDDVIFAGRLSAEDLQFVTASALASVYVSYFEGFGIPIVEAFKCDTPVITSNVTSMPEVANDAALLVDPFNEESIADAMEKILDEEVRNNLIGKGRIRRQDFSWDKAAETWWKCIEKL